MSTRVSVKSNIDFKILLRNSGLKITKARLDILGFLAKSKKPVSINDMVVRLPILNQATIYRAIHSLLEIGVIRSVDLRHGHAHYELAIGDNDHHHIICTRCGRIEDFSECNMDIVVASVLGGSSHFSRVIDHSMELFGICTKCDN